jgi:predicted amidophosphoribosyltransferase
MSISQEVLFMLGERRATKKLSQQFGICPSCSRDIRICGRLTIGMEVRCSSCGDELQVIDTDPIELDWLYDYDSDHYDYEDDRDR